jgi:hypothetical protein
VNFINIKKHKVKKITVNVFIPVLLGAIMLIGNTISISGYNLSMPKSFAKETKLTSNFNSNPQQTSSLHHHSAIHTAAGQSNFNSNPQQTSNIHSAGQSVFRLDPSAMAVPFSGVSGVGGNNTLVSTPGSSVVLNSNNPLCNAISQTGFANSSTSVSICNNHNDRHPVFDFTKSLTNSKNVDISHSDTRFHVVGPDKFKFINSYWTTGETSRTIDAGSSANNTFLGAGSADTNPKLETDINKGPSTLALRIQYEGVVQLSGVTAALKLPPGFTSSLPLIHDPNRHDIAFSNYEGNIYPGQGIVLYFSINILNNTQLTPYLAPLALHVLRADQRISTDGIDASQQDQFASTLNIQNATSPFSFGFNNNGGSPSTRTFNDNGSFSQTFHKVNERLKPFDFVNQVIPVLFKITGEETLIVNVLPGTGTNTTVPSSPFLVLAPPGLPTTVRLLVNNTGDAPVYDLTATVSPRDESAIAATVVPSATNIPNVVQQNAIQPLVLIGPTQKNLGFIPANSSSEIDVTIVPSFYVGGTVEPIFVNLEYNNIVGQDATLTLPIGVEILPVTGQAALHNALQVPTSLTNNQLHVSNELSNRALNAMTNIAVSGNGANNAGNNGANNAGNNAASAAHGGGSGGSGSGGSGSGGSGGR